MRRHEDNLVILRRNIEVQQKNEMVSSVEGRFCFQNKEMVLEILNAMDPLESIDTLVDEVGKSESRGKFLAI